MPAHIDVGCIKRKDTYRLLSFFPMTFYEGMLLYNFLKENFNPGIKDLTYNQKEYSKLYGNRSPKVFKAHGICVLKRFTKYFNNTKNALEFLHNGYLGVLYFRYKKEIENKVAEDLSNYLISQDTIIYNRLSNGVVNSKEIKPFLQGKL